MDFDRVVMQKQGYGNYEELDPTSLPPLYIAYDPARSEGSGVLHSHMTALFEEGDERVIGVMDSIGDLARQARDLLVAGRGAEIGPLMDRNFDQRASIYSLSRENIAMVEAARATGASAKFSGSGGAIIGTYAGEEMYAALQTGLGRIGCQVFKPEIAS